MLSVTQAEADFTASVAIYMAGFNAGRRSETQDTEAAAARFSARHPEATEIDRALFYIAFDEAICEEPRATADDIYYKVMGLEESRARWAAARAI